MTELKVGDHVVVDTDTPHSQWYQCEGIVRESRARPNSGKVELTKLGPNAKYLKVGDTTTLFNLELINPAFTFADIQINDRIRRTLTRDTGTTEVREGTVVAKNGGLAVDRDGPLSYILAYDSDGHHDKPMVVLELLDRPKPKHWTETKPVGSVAIILDGTFTKTLKKTSEFVWNVLYAEDEHTYDASNTEVKNRTEQWASDTKLTWIK